MNKEQAVKNLQLLINSAVQKGLFNAAQDVIGMQQSLNYLNNLQDGNQKESSEKGGTLTPQ